MERGVVRAFYEAGLTALQHLEHRAPTGRRFGQDADLRWSSFRGHLQDIDRIDLLIRDADAQWPGSMGARRVFNRPGVAEDDAFGKGWEPLDPVVAAELWRDVDRAPSPQDLGAALSRMTDTWEFTLLPFANEPVAPSSRLLAAGPSAVAALAHAFDGRADLDWGDQVVVVASDPAPRQLAAFCGAALNVTKRAPTLLAAQEFGPALSGYTLVISPDASEADRGWANALVEG